MEIVEADFAAAARATNAWKESGSSRPFTYEPVVDVDEDEEHVETVVRVLTGPELEREISLARSRVSEERASLARSANASLSPEEFHRRQDKIQADVVAAVALASASRTKWHARDASEREAAAENLCYVYEAFGLVNCIPGRKPLRRDMESLRRMQRAMGHTPQVQEDADLVLRLLLPGRVHLVSEENTTPVRGEHYCLCRSLDGELLPAQGFVAGIRWRGTIRCHVNVADNSTHMSGLEGHYTSASSPLDAHIGLYFQEAAHSPDYQQRDLLGLPRDASLHAELSSSSVSASNHHATPVPGSPTGRVGATRRPS